MPMTCVGLRVLRGPDWEGGEADGGEGHLGTVIGQEDGDRVHVLWDLGQRSVCRTGAQGKCDLRIFDTAPVGVCHAGSVCAVCEQRDIYGMMWRCTSCRSCNLCPLCYVSDKHDVSHEFVRHDKSGCTGVPVKKRLTSLKIRALGIFPGAKVQRGKDWAWKDQDGGEGQVGEAVMFEDLAPDSRRNIVKVLWPNGNANSYRLGFKGNVDLTCVEQAAGTHYYREHLPVLDTSGTVSSPASTSGTNDAPNLVFPPSSPTTKTDNLHSNQDSASTSKTSSGKEEDGGEREKGIAVGDKVLIAVDEDKLKELQVKFGGHNVTMIKCIGKTGEAVSFASNGAVQVKFNKIPYRFNPSCLVKVPLLTVGDKVRIRSDLEQVKLLNKKIGWNSSMEQSLGKVGQVVRVNADGYVVVRFGQTNHTFSPACCICVPSDTSCDALASSSTSDSQSSSTPTSDSDGFEKFLKFFGQMVLEGTGGGGGGGGGGPSSRGGPMDRLFRAIAEGKTEAVRSLCQNNVGLANRKHKGFTPLIVASHEGQKDVCSCLLVEGADINGQGDQQMTPLAAALQGKQEQIAVFLLEKGAKPNRCNATQTNPLHLAANGNLPEVIKVLVQKGANVNAKDSHGDTALHNAIREDKNDAVEMLLRAKNIDLQSENAKGFNMLQLACQSGNPFAVERILSREGVQVNKLLGNQYSALHFAANIDHVDCLKLLVKNGNAKINLQGHDKMTPLHMACLKGHVRSAEALVQMGASVNVQDSNGDTPLHLTVGIRIDGSETLLGQQLLKQRVRMACVLLSKGAYPDVQNKNGAVPLQCCPDSALKSAVQLFMQQNPALIKKAGPSRGRGTPASSLFSSQSQCGVSSVGLEALFGGMTLPCGSPGCSRMSDVTLFPCGHKTLCHNCCLNTSECPLCETIILRREAKGVDMINECKQM